MGDEPVVVQITGFGPLQQSTLMFHKTAVRENPTKGCSRVDDYFLLVLLGFARYDAGAGKGLDC